MRYDALAAHNYNYFRDYDPAVGRYVESDPVAHMPKWQLAGLATSKPDLGVTKVLAFDGRWRISRGYLSLLQPYAYVTANPLTYFDPLGLAPIRACEDFEGWGQTICEACVKAFCQTFPVAQACCAIERDECYGNSGGDPIEMQKCVFRYGRCVAKDPKGGKKPQKPPEEI